MALEAIKQVSGRGVYVAGNDIDTDRIIPARFMKCVTFDGLGRYAFHDARFDEAGNATSHALNDPRFAGAEVLVSNLNFGCGSSREHAPQALAKAGFRAVVAQSYAEIFFGNAATLGIPCVSLSAGDIEALAAIVEAEPATIISVDLEAQVVRAGDNTEFASSMKESARDALISGRWDPIGELLETRARVAEVAAKLPYMTPA